MSEKYAFRAGARVRVDAQTAGEELERIRVEQGAITAPAVIDAAKPKDAPLHPAFTWDNRTAAHQWRLHEARHLIRSVQVVREDSEPRLKYVHVRGGKDDSRYEDVDVVVNSEALFAQALAALNKRLQEAKRAVHDLEAAAEGTDDSERMARIALAVRAVDTAAAAVRALH